VFIKVSVVNIIIIVHFTQNLFTQIYLQISVAQASANCHHSCHSNTTVHFKSCFKIQLTL